MVDFLVAHPKTKPFNQDCSWRNGGCWNFAGDYFQCSFLPVIISCIQRVVTWLQPDKHMAEGGYQVMQGLYAIGSGGFWGKGLGNSVQKLSAIPEVQNDMILAAICEELGIFGAIVILIPFLACFYIA